MFLKRLMGLIFVGALALSTVSAEIVVRIAPPKVRVENHGSRPSPNHVWVSGYHSWDGNRYNWNGGRWEQPPRAHAHWVAHHWVHRGNGWVLVEGRWN
jgi:hypothetical protein